MNITTAQLEQIVATAVAQALATVALDAETPTPAAAPKVKAEPRYRTAKQIADGRARYEALWTSLKKANPGVPSKDLAKAHRTELNACYAKGTRKSPVSK